MVAVRLMNSTGSLVDVLNINKEDISKEVILLGAVRINRFLGQTRYGYPVAAHLVGGYRYLLDTEAPALLRKQWLIHEAYESMTGVDLPSPLKAALPLYKEAEKRALRVIADFFGVEPPESEGVKSLDKAIMVAEALALMPNKEYWLNFAKEQNIIPISSKYILSKEECEEENLYKTLEDIWDREFR